MVFTLTAWIPFSWSRFLLVCVTAQILSDRPYFVMGPCFQPLRTGLGSYSRSSDSGCP